MATETQGKQETKHWSRRQVVIYFLFGIIFSVAYAFSMLGLRELWEFGFIPRWAVLTIGFTVFFGCGGYIFWFADKTVMTWARKLKLL